MILLPGMELFLQLQVHDKYGNLVYDTGLLKAESYLEQFVQHIRCAFNDTNESSVVDTGSTSRTLLRPRGSSNEFMYAVGGAGTAGQGIVVGTGTTAVDIADRALVTKVAHGTSATQLDYQAQSISAISTGATSSTFSMIRAMVNSSGGSIVVGEAGIECTSRDDGATNRQFLLVRDKLPSTVTVLDTETLTGTYLIKAEE